MFVFVVIVPRISKKCQFALIKNFKNPNLVTLHFVKIANHAIFAKGFRFVDLRLICFATIFCNITKNHIK